LIASLDGVIESTGQAIQVRSSYLPEEILWDHQFEEIIMIDDGEGSVTTFDENVNINKKENTKCCKLDYERFNQVCSTTEL